MTRHLSQRTGGLWCTAERFARKITGQQDAEYGLFIDNGQLVLGSGRYYRVFETPVTRGLADRLGVGKRVGKIRDARGSFDDAGKFQVVTPKGEVLWRVTSSAEKGGGGGGWRSSVAEAKAKTTEDIESPKQTKRRAGVAARGDGRVHGGFGEVVEEWDT